MPIRIAMIGAGSIGFTRKLMHDVLAGVEALVSPLRSLKAEALAATSAEAS